MAKTRKFIYAKHFEGAPKLTDFELVEEELPDLQDGEYLCESLYLSVDPYMKVVTHPVGHVMMGGQIAKILKSKNPNFPIGKLVYGEFGWTTHTVVNSEKKIMFTQPYLLPDYEDILPSYYLGVLGMPGNTAYFGVLEICQPKQGETMVITAAAGAVGTHVGQIAKILGCKVIGFTGSEEKCNWLKNELHFDHAFNYKSIDIFKALNEAAPNGIDCYFDCVGGELSTNIMLHMNMHGRIAVCGAMSAYEGKYNLAELPTAPMVQPIFIYRQLKMEGYIVKRWLSRWMEGVRQNTIWIREGKLKVFETVTNGFENMPRAFIEMYSGKNFGKAIVKCN